MANPAYKYTDRLQLMLLIGIVGTGAGALLAGLQLHKGEEGSVGPLLVGLAVLSISVFVAFIGATGLGVKFGHLAAQEQAGVADAAGAATDQ